MDASGLEIDLSGFRLEAHVNSAVAVAQQHAAGLPVDAASWLRAAARVARLGSSPAFDQLRILLPPEGDDPVLGSKALAKVSRLEVTRGLARSFETAMPFLADTHELWGRDYVTIGVLADEPGVEELARRAGMSLQELRAEWRKFVQRDVSRRQPQAWEVWWEAAGAAVGQSSEAPGFVPDRPEHTAGLVNILRTAAERSPHPVSAVHLLLTLVSLGRPGPEPAWAADFLMRELAGYPAYAEAAERVRSGGASPSVQQLPVSGVERVAATHALAACLARAAVLARRTTGRGIIAGRHLLASLITSEPGEPEPESLALLRDAQVDLALLRQRLYDWLRGFGDNDAEWFVVLVGGTPPRLRAGFDADATTGPDLLNIEPEVQALATLIAARDSLPPLSVGLFGDWGSGKTFFMRRLQKAVGQLSREARQSGVMQRDLPYYKRVVQIEFNAWHYVEGNLWASLVEHILSHLQVGDDMQGSLTEELQRHWIERLGFAEQLRVGAEGTRQAAEGAVQQAQVALRQAEDAHEQRKQALAQLSAASVKRDFALSGAGDVVRKALEPLGLKALGDGALELQSALTEARGVLQHGMGVMTPLLRAPDRAARQRRLIAVLAGAPIAGLLVGVLVSPAGNELIAQLSAWATGAAGLLTAGARWLRDQAQWVSQQIGHVEAAQKQYDADLRERLAQTEAAKARAAEELSLAQQKLAQAGQAVEQARRQAEQAQADLAAATTSRLLGRFIQDRAASSDYRKHLGVLAVVRQDFEKLSRLIEEENWRLAPPAAGDERAPKNLRKIATLQEEEQDAPTRINRIVLYIDDLDRCPPAKVVDVLQAVHLLLAFPLFVVVVVGVDARWISRSLKTRYGELLHAGDSAVVDPSFGAAHSRDYLEKIFQIPLWLRPMGRADAQRMVYGMLRRDDPPAAAPVPALAAPPPPGPMPPAVPVPAPPQATVDAVPPPPQAAASVPIAAAAASHVQQAEQMQVGAQEHEIIDSLAPLLGRSPRSLKRFVNVYRLIKAGLTPAELAGFTRDDGTSLPPCAAVLLLLLAVDTGLPEVSPRLHEALAQGVGEKLGAQSLIQWFDALKDPQPADWPRLRAWIERFQRHIDGAAIVRMASWVPRVARYSFQSPHGEAG